MASQRIFWTVIFSMISVISGFGQTLQGSIVDENTNIPLSYVNIGIIGTNIGVNSDDSGLFEIDVPSNLNDNTIIFSLVGYQDHSMKLETFRKQIAAGQTTIKLSRVENVLQEVVVRPSDYMQMILGNDYSCLPVKDAKKQISMPFIFETKEKRKGKRVDTLTEIGTLMKVKKGRTFIDSVQINIGYCNYDEFIFRLNIYEQNQ